jgi:hypothetical protein
MRVAARTVALDLPKGRYLLRAEPAAASRPGPQFSADVTQALRRAAGQVTP